MKNRILVFLANFCTYLGGIGIIVGLFWDFAADRYYLFSTLLCSGLMGNLFSAHCPICNKIGLYGTGVGSVCGFGLIRSRG